MGQGVLVEYLVDCADIVAPVKVDSGIGKLDHRVGRRGLYQIGLTRRVTSAIVAVERAGTGLRKRILLVRDASYYNFSAASSEFREGLIEGGQGPDTGTRYRGCSLPVLKPANAGTDLRFAYSLKLIPA